MSLLSDLPNRRSGIPAWVHPGTKHRRTRLPETIVTGHYHVNPFSRPRRACSHDFLHEASVSRRDDRDPDVGDGVTTMARARHHAILGSWDLGILIVTCFVRTVGMTCITPRADWSWAVFSCAKATRPSPRTGSLHQTDQVGGTEGEQRDEEVRGHDGHGDALATRGRDCEGGKRKRRARPRVMRRRRAPLRPTIRPRADRRSAGPVSSGSSVRGTTSGSAWRASRPTARRPGHHP